MGLRQRVAVIGCGFFAPNHIRAWGDLDEAELVAVCDLDPAKAAEGARIAGGVPAFTDAAAMIEATGPDVVDIVTTAPSHLALARLCAEKRTPCIIQKPLAMEFAVAQAIGRIAETSGVPMMVHENFRFLPHVMQVKEIVASGAIGRPTYFHVGFRCGHDIFTGQPYLRTEQRLVLMDLGVHVFDLARYFMGEVASLSARTLRVRPDVAGEDVATALVGFESGAMGLVECSWSSFRTDDPFPQTFVAVEGTEGAVVLGRDYAIEVKSGVHERRIAAEPAGPTWGTRPWHAVQASVVETCRHWLDFAAGRTPLATSVADNLKTLALVEAAYASAAADGARIVPARA